MEELTKPVLEQVERELPSCVEKCDKFHSEMLMKAKEDYEALNSLIETILSVSYRAFPVESTLQNTLGALSKEEVKPYLLAKWQKRFILFSASIHLSVQM